METVLPFAAWENFYVIVGSSAAALTGLQFVVIVLGAEINAGSNNSVTRAFGTPTIVHFCAVLLLGAILSAPWPGLASAGIALTLCGAVGVLYAMIVIRHTRHQTDYKMVLEDWIWHCTLPLVGYSMLLGAALALTRHPAPLPVRDRRHRPPPALRGHPQRLGRGHLHRDRPAAEEGEGRGAPQALEAAPLSPAGYPRPKLWTHTTR